MTDYVAQARRELEAALAASLTAGQAAGVIAWLRARLEEKRDAIGDAEGWVVADSELLLLDLHAGVVALNDADQRVWRFRAKCARESWTCYGDGEDLVQAPCLHVRLLARQFAGRRDFPKPLVLDDARAAVRTEIASR